MKPKPTEMDTRIEQLLRLFGKPNELYCRYFRLGGTRGCIVYHTSAADKEKIQNDVLKPLLAAAGEAPLDELLPIAEPVYARRLDELVRPVLEGKCAILLEAHADVLLADVALVEARSIATPENEQSIRGSQEAFIEDCDVNAHLVHKRLQNAKLAQRHYMLGTENPTKVSMLYVEDLADAQVASQIASRLQASRIRYVKSPGQISEALEMKKFSIMPQVLQTERPDTTAAHLMEGRIAILIDNCSYAVILPVTFFQFFQAADDFNLRWWNGSFFRLLRLFAGLLTLILPSVYISIISSHFEVLPIDLVFSMKASLENVPLNPVVEALFMTIVLELLKEAAIRLPKTISPALSTVGGLVIGTEVVRANLVSTTMIVVIALTAVASFSVPNYEMRLSLRFVSIPIMFAAALMGFAGIAFSFSLLLMYLCSLETYGIPYFYPLSPLKPKRLLLAIIQLPFKLIRR